MKKIAVISFLAVLSLFSLFVVKNSSATVIVCKDCPTVTWNGASECPSGYSPSSITCLGGCYKNGHQTDASKCVNKNTFGPITFKYEKSSDPNHCHRPTASNLGVPSWAENEFNNDNPELEDSFVIACATSTSTATATATATSRCSSTPTATPTATTTPTVTTSATATATSTPIETETPVTDPTATPGGDVCANLEGIQTSLPDDTYHFDLTGKNCLQFSVPGAPEPSNSGIGGGQVLGASTMAGTGVVEDAIFNSIFALGSLLTSFGIIKKSAKSKEHSS